MGGGKFGNVKGDVVKTGGGSKKIGWVGAASQIYLTVPLFRRRSRGWRDVCLMFCLYFVTDFSV